MAQKSMLESVKGEIVSAIKGTGILWTPW